jgi:hypothetical protein
MVLGADLGCGMGLQGDTMTGFDRVVLWCSQLFSPPNPGRLRRWVAAMTVTVFYS